MDPAPSVPPTSLTVDLEMEPPATPKPPARALPVKSQTPATCSQTSTGITRSQHLFHSAMQIHPNSLMIKGDTELFLFMEMRAEFHWISYEMTLGRWVDATEEFNCRLVKKCGVSAIRKMLHKMYSCRSSEMNVVSREVLMKRHKFLKGQQQGKD